MLLATWALCCGHSTHTSSRASFSAWVLQLKPASQRVKIWFKNTVLPKNWFPKKAAERNWTSLMWFWIYTVYIRFIYYRNMKYVYIYYVYDYLTRVASKHRWTWCGGSSAAWAPWHQAVCPLCFFVTSCCEGFFSWTIFQKYIPSHHPTPSFQRYSYNIICTVRIIVIEYHGHLSEACLSSGVTGVGEREGGVRGACRH